VSIDRRHKHQPVHPGQIRTGVAGEQVPAVLKGWLEHVWSRPVLVRELWQVSDVCALPTLMGRSSTRPPSSKLKSRNRPL
jgi:hypothetical protein